MWMLRQNPYGDKVAQECCFDYIMSFISRNMVPIPFLHNSDVIHDIGLTSDMTTPNQYIDCIMKSSSHVLDADNNKRLRKKNKIIKLLSNITDVFIPIPKSRCGIIAVCSPTLCLVTRDFHLDENKRLRKGNNEELTSCINITKVYYVHNIPRSLRLPPCSIQRLTPEIVDTLWSLI